MRGSGGCVVLSRVSNRRRRLTGDERELKEGEGLASSNPLSEHRKKLLVLSSASKLGKFKNLVESVVDLEAAPREFLVSFSCCLMGDSSPKTRG